MTNYPLEHGLIAPGDDFTKMEMGLRPDGLPDGYHSGGPYLSPDGRSVWKPLDAKPWANADKRYDTDEDKCLEAMTGTPGFLENWHTEEQNGRRWLVRPFCYLWPQDRDKLIKPKLEVFLMIEAAIRRMNELQWTYNDMPQLAYDLTVHEWFLLDCSNAHHQMKWHHGDGDWYRFDNWYKLMGFPNIHLLRERGRYVAHAIKLPDFCDPEEEPFHVEDRFYPLTEEERRKHIHLYVSLLRPLSTVWCKIKGTVFLRPELDKKPRVHTWIAADHPLDDDVLRKYELTHAYSPWP